MQTNDKFIAHDNVYELKLVQTIYTQSIRRKSIICKNLSEQACRLFWCSCQIWICIVDVVYSKPNPKTNIRKKSLNSIHFKL